MLVTWIFYKIRNRTVVDAYVVYETALEHKKSYIYMRANYHNFEITSHLS